MAFEAAKTWFAEAARIGSPPPSNLGMATGPDFVQLSASLARSLIEGRLGVPRCSRPCQQTGDKEIV
jgi:hypothetical protein